MSKVHLLLESHPEWSAVAEIYHTLTKHGYKAFLAGGCVRDALLGVVAHDLDVATDASPDQVEALFKKTVNVGKSFGVIRVLLGDADIEVATFRTDLSYKDGRRPEGVLYSSPEEDARRRDFTVNALFYDLKNHQILDFVGGVDDLNNRILKTVGNPESRFQEDHLRLLRGARFVSQLDFSMEANSFQAMQRMAPLVKTVSGERIRDEMGKLLKGPAAARGLQVMIDTGLMGVLFPFRLRAPSWDKSLGATELWHYFSLFLRGALQAELAESLEALRLSSRERKAIEKAWSLWQKAEDFFALSLGKKLRMLSVEGVQWALQVLWQEKNLWHRDIEELFQAWQSWGEQLPKAFLNGDDLKGKMSGKKIGIVLDLSFEMQLEKKLESREKALMWLSDYLKRENNG